jgi:hypothetical protein
MTDLANPMPLSSVLMTIINPALSLLPVKMDSPKARLQLLAQGQQESRFMYRTQQGNGPARGFWQMEAGGGVKGVMEHPAVSTFTRDLCSGFAIPWERPDVWAAMATNDEFAAACARLLLWTDPKPLPDLGDHEGAWQLYLRVWRPGKPRRESWDAFYDAARAVLGV